ncbi:hypothetical protein, variant 1 [Aphanomyces astaci]|uniref:Vacuolar protein sorting-associated protein 54 N-terminal domain-containing protein n=1 Tax=Aphanomyces astaci TaxID=112090 RepID=W4GI97_APHAT|nr:hypothetical protein, variant 1 [Aphanomyces astaci]ETV78759.1 hypothetical protein, variant 1 [Aphanomyces astaci]|eukprot:XP_009831478.1 hypothetical protein, variant 1 [Aphanomyces astaci]
MHRQTAMGSPSSPEKSPERMDPSSAMASEGLSLDALGSEDSVLNNLDPRFFTQHFDPVQHMLESLPTNPFALIDHLQSEIGAMDIAKDVVTSKLAEEIQRNYHTFIQGMNHVQEVDLDLAQALIQVKNGRRLLAIHKKDLVMSHLELVKLRRNRDRVHTIVDHASSILDCFKHEQDMVAAVHDKAFERAVRVCAALRHRATHLHQFSVLKQCIQRMHLALPELRQHFHSALGDLLVSFDGHVYDELLRALAALDAHLSSSSPSKGTPPTGRSPMRAVVGTDDVVRVVVAAMDELTRGAVANLLDTTSTGASIAMVVDAVLNVYELLASLLHNLDLFEQWHEKRGERDDAAAADAFRQVRPLMWESLQRRMGDAWTRLTWPNDTKVEHVVGLTHATETLVAMGMDFAKTSSTDMIQGNTLQSAFVGTVLVFLTELLHDNMELMRMMMDTEKWERLSVDTANNIWRLLESRSGFTLTQPIPPCPSSSSPRTPTAWWNPFQGGAARSRYINVPSMEKFVATCGPTCEADDQAPTHQMNVNATPDEQELFGSTHVVTWSTYSGFLRVCGQYVKWVHEMAWVRTHLYAHLLAVFEFNLYTIFRRCCPDASISRLLARQTPTDLACHHLRDWVLVQNQQNHPPHHLPPDGPSDDDTLVRRIVAVESVAFQWHVLSTIIAAHDQQRHDVLALVVHEARAYVYAGLVPQAIHAAGIPRLIEHATWDVVGTRHNEYVVTLVRHCGLFWGTLQGSAVPVAVRDELWAVVVRAVMEALVDGYANVKKCSAEGRALMSMDLMALQNGLDLINHTVRYYSTSTTSITSTTS